jgi:hypothetical protein
MKIIVKESQFLRVLEKKLLKEYNLPENDYHELLGISIYYDKNKNQSKNFSKDDDITFILNKSTDEDILNIRYILKMKRSAIGTLDTNSYGWSTEIEGPGIQSRKIDPPYNLEQGKTYYITLRRDLNSLGGFTHLEGYYTTSPFMKYSQPSGVVSLTPITLKDFKDSPEEINACKKVYSQTALKGAVNWWKNKFTPEFAKRISDINLPYNKKITPEYVINNIFPKYVKILDGIKYYYLSSNSVGTNYYYNDKRSTYAWVYDSKEKLYDGRIYVNCALYKDEKNAVSKIAHELQHKLYGVFKMTPDENTNQIFGTGKNIKKNSKDKSSKDSEKTDNELNSNEINYWINQGKENKNDPYTCDPSEQLSRLKEMQTKYNIPEGGFSVDFFIPFIKQKSNEDSMSWFLTCWGVHGCIPIEQVVMNLNDKVAMNDIFINKDIPQKNNFNTFT